MKACVACAEEIQNAAKLCRFCGTRQDDLSFLSAEKASTGHDASSLNDSPQLEEESAKSGSPALRIFLLASLVVIPSTLLLLLDPTLSDSGALEGVGNFSASVGGFSVLGVLTAAALFPIPAMRTPSRRQQLRFLLLSFGAWAVLGLSMFAMTALAGGFSHANSSGTPASTPPVGSSTPFVGPTPTTEMQPYPKTLKACKEFLVYDWGQFGSDEDGLAQHASSLSGIFAVAENPRILNSAKNLIGDLTGFGVAVRSGAQSDAQLFRDLSRTSMSVLTAQCEDLGNGK